MPVKFSAWNGASIESSCGRRRGAQGQRGAGALSYVVMGLVCSALLVVGMRARKASRRGTVAVAVPHGYVELSAMDTTGA